LKTGKVKPTQQKTAKKKKKEGTKTRSSSPSHHQEFQDELKCVHCGSTKHIFARCKYRAYKCKIYSKEGHLAKICRNNKNAVSSTNYLESEKKEEEIVDMYSLSSAAAVKSL